MNPGPERRSSDRIGAARPGLLLRLDRRAPERSAPPYRQSVAGCLLLAVLAGATPAMAQRLPVPPIPPANPPSGDLAPRPNRDILPPNDPESGVRVRPEVFSAERPETSMGFAPGSRYQASDEKRPLQTPGVRLTVPLR